jgi:hypothetical protein
VVRGALESWDNIRVDLWDSFGSCGEMNCLSLLGLSGIRDLRITGFCRLKQHFNPGFKHFNPGFKRWVGNVFLAGFLAIVLLTAAWMSPAWAEPMPSETLAPTPAIPSDKVTQFASAYRRVLQIVDRREVALQSAETESIAARILRDVEMEALRAIGSAGLSRQEYVQLLNLVSVDGEFGEEVALALQELDGAVLSATK